MTLHFHSIVPPPEAIAVPEYDAETGELVFVEVGHALAKLIDDNGFIINESKVRLQSKGCRQEVTGLIVNEKANVKRRYIRQIRAMLHAWRAFGYVDAQKEYWEKYSPGGRETDFDDVLRGKISFVRHIKGSTAPVFLKLAGEFNDLTEGKQIPLELSPTEKAEQATWITEAPLEQGTAFLLDGYGFVTCAHCCVAEDGSIVEDMKVWHPDDPSTKYSVEVKKFDADRDLAILSIPKELAKLFPLSLSTADTSQASLPIKLFGYPNHSPGSPIRRESGQIVRQLTKSSVRYLEVTTKIIEGNSGGPVLDENHKVVGIATKGLNHGTNITGAEFFAISVAELKEIT